MDECKIFGGWVGLDSKKLCHVHLDLTCKNIVTKRSKYGAHLTACKKYWTEGYRTEVDNLLFMPDESWREVKKY